MDLLTVKTVKHTIMNYSNFEPQNNMRPKSPALKSYYPHNSNFRYQPNRQGPYNKFANRKWSSTYDDNRKKPYQPKNNRLDTCFNFFNSGI